MILLRKLIKEMIEDVNVQFSNWKRPSDDQLKNEFEREHRSKGNDFFDSEEDFIEAIHNADEIIITSNDDSLIDYRSGTRSKEELLRLIKGYRSYPQFRNEKTLDAIYDGFKNNLPMDMPIVIEFTDGERRVFSGNTRMDIAFQLGINPCVLLVKSDREYY